MQERKQYKISLPMTEKQKNKVEELLKFASFDGTPFRLEEIENTLEEPEEKEWPQDDCVYYFIDSNGEIRDDWFYLEDAPCESRLSIGNCFKTKEEAEFEVERLKVIAEMKNFAEPEDRKWNNCNKHWYFYYAFANNTFRYSVYVESKSDDIHFESKEKAEKCVKTVGEDRIKKYYLRIKE